MSKKTLFFFRVGQSVREWTKGKHYSKLMKYSCGKEEAIKMRGCLSHLCCGNNLKSPKSLQPQRFAMSLLGSAPRFRLKEHTLSGEREKWISKLLLKCSTQSACCCAVFLNQVTWIGLASMRWEHTLVAQGPWQDTWSQTGKWRPLTEISRDRLEQ